MTNETLQQQLHCEKRKWDSDWTAWLNKDLERKCDPNGLMDILLEEGFDLETIHTHMTATTLPSGSSDWQQWSALNLIKQNDANVLVNKMVVCGVETTEAQKIVQEAATHPYVEAALSMGRQSKKQEWLLDTLRQLGELSKSVTQVQRRSNLTPEAFLEEYYSTNRPVIITDCLQQWEALKLWTPDYLKEHFGNFPVAIQSKRENDAHYPTNVNNLRTELLLSEYVDMVKSVEKSNDFYMTANDTKYNRPLVEALQLNMRPTIPYLNPTAENSNGFFWFGPAGTITPTHHDLTNNFMAQVHGRKQVKLINAAQQPRMYNHLHVYSQVDLSQIDYDRFPLVKGVNIIDVILEPGEILFLPIGWWHHVTALDVSITMSYTNFIYANTFTQNYTTYDEI